MQFRCHLHLHGKFGKAFNIRTLGLKGFHLEERLSTQPIFASSRKSLPFWQGTFATTVDSRFSENHGVWKSQKKSHSTLRAKRAMFTFWVDKSSLKMPKIVNFWKPELRPNSVTRQVKWNRTKIGGKCQNRTKYSFFPSFFLYFALHRSSFVLCGCKIKRLLAWGFFLSLSRNFN